MAVVQCVEIPYIQLQLWSRRPMSPTSASDLRFRPPTRNPPQRCKCINIWHSCSWNNCEGTAILTKYAWDRVFRLFFLCTCRVLCMFSGTICAVLANNVNEAAKKRDRLGCFLMYSGQCGKSIYTSIYQVQYWLLSKVNGTAFKFIVRKVREGIIAIIGVNCFKI